MPFALVQQSLTITIMLCDNTVSGVVDEGDDDDDDLSDLEGGADADATSAKQLSKKHQVSNSPALCRAYLYMVHTCDVAGVAFTCAV